MLKGAVDALDSKQTTLFKNLVKLYETKQYKKGLKQAEKLLEQKPNHSESLAMKAIFLYNTGKKQEGFDLSKKAVSLNFKSDIAWHIYGIIHRQNRNYPEAIKCYKQALTTAPDNVQILKDLALLQIQIRDIDGLCETRKKILLNKDSLVINWVGYAIALHFKGEYEQTLQIIDSINTITKNNPLKGMEKSEFLIYHSQVIGDSGDYNRQLKFLEENKNDILDKVKYNELMVEIYQKLNQLDQAELFVYALIDDNPFNKDNYKLLQVVKQLPKNPENDNQRETILQLYEQLYLKYKVNIIKYIALDYVKEENFKTKITEYIIPYFRKGMTSLFSEIKHFYKYTNKSKIIEQVLQENLLQLETSSKFCNSEEVETPCCLLWCYMLLAQHFDKVQQYEKAQEFVNKAINHTPTLIELYLVKAKIHKHLFQYQLAFEQTEKSRNMDLADRYLNNKSIKYALRCGFTKKAEYLLKLFLKDINESNPYELQSLWYEVAQDQKKQEEEQRIKNMSQAEKKKWKKQQQQIEENKVKEIVEEFKIKLDLNGEEFQNIAPLKEANISAKILVHLNIQNSKLAFQNFSILVDFYIQTERTLLLITSFIKLQNSQYCEYRIHTFKLKTAQYCFKCDIILQKNNNTQLIEYLEQSLLNNNLNLNDSILSFDLLCKYQQNSLNNKIYENLSHKFPQQAYYFSKERYIETDN
ncbi:hypothetical protein IMG5_000490 [Ichthyophthirius multifiliis]|uniref:Tetratricopeptide repeat protein n=1 Tax=Ichthyophthirius multifiliis TaxID=5932 RepID=G0QIT6_ICHMU|nr:hypothetical protein IMG5_000490 [Ichthyophthirius multifiliis]EGR34822.1 hypothetical protein IMG5_000490 [Ichthyophthirius multifiliis]|eukprot:XP_004040126.1 hypothetical protein IMG5_000490 [Ichthyophthirius multifiliis]